MDLKNADGSWTFSLNGNLNVEYIWSSCQSATSAVDVGGGLTCVGSTSSSNVSNIGNGLLPAAFVFGVATTQAGFDITGHLGLYPGIATNAACRGQPGEELRAQRRQQQRYHRQRGCVLLILRRAGP